MNERIKELEKLATEVEHSHGAFGEDEKYYRLNTEKFAELIVKECAAYINGRTADWEAKLRWIFNDGSGYMDVDADSLLNEHFGITE